MRNFLQKLKEVDLRKGIDRAYFVLVIAWYVFVYAVMATAISEDNINPFANDLGETILVHLFVLLVPIGVYFALIVLAKIIVWIVKGFNPSSSLKVSMRSEGDLIELIKEYKFFIIGGVLLLLLLNLFVSFSADFSSYQEKHEATKVSPGVRFPVLPRLPTLPSLPPLP